MSINDPFSLLNEKSNSFLNTILVFPLRMDFTVLLGFVLGSSEIATRHLGTTSDLQVCLICCDLPKARGRTELNCWKDLRSPGAYFQCDSEEQTISLLIFFPHLSFLCSDLYFLWEGTVSWSAGSTYRWLADMEAGPPTCWYFATKQVHDDLITKEHKEQWLAIYSNVPCVLGFFFR